MRVNQPTTPEHAPSPADGVRESAASGAGLVPLAYLSSRYPAVSHTFILREVLRLRELDFEVHTASINAAGLAPEGPTEVERGECENTFYVKQAGLFGTLGAHFATLVRHPLRYVAGLGTALRLGGADLRALLYSCFYFAEAVVIGRWMERNGARHLHVHFANPAALVGLLVARIFGVTYSITVHGPDEFYDAFRQRLAEKLGAADFVCCIGHYARSQLSLLSDATQWSKFEVCPLGVDPTRFEPRTPPVASPGRPFEILCVGRLTPAKGQHVLIAAVDRLIREGRHVVLRLVGDGPDRASLEAEARRRELGDRCVFTGAVNQDQVGALYAAADVFVLASFAEGIPVVLMEAMAMEVPCITTFITGIPELIRTGEDGLLVPPSDEVGLAQAIARLADDDALRRRLGRAGRERVLDKYDLRRNTERLAAIFERRLSSLHAPDRGHAHGDPDDAGGGRTA